MTLSPLPLSPRSHHQRTRGRMPCYPVIVTLSPSLFSAGHPHNTHRCLCVSMAPSEVSNSCARGLPALLFAASHRLCPFSRPFAQTGPQKRWRFLSSYSPSTLLIMACLKAEYNRRVAMHNCCQCWPYSDIFGPCLSSISPLVCLPVSFSHITLPVYIFRSCFSIPILKRATALVFSSFHNP